MNLRDLRGFVVSVYVIAFVLAVLGLTSIPGETWNYIDWWQKTLFAFYILVGFCGVLIAYWVYVDDNEIEKLRVRLSLTDKEVQEIRDKMKKTS